jgi:hypothetical protein
MTSTTSCPPSSLLRNSPGGAHRIIPGHASLRSVIRAGDRANDLVKQILTFTAYGDGAETRPFQIFVKEVMKLLR